MGKSPLGDIIYKLKLLPLIIPILRHAKAAAEYETIEPKNRKSKAVQKEVEYWSIVSEVGRDRDVKIKVVLKRDGTGNFLERNEIEEIENTPCGDVS